MLLPLTDAKIGCELTRKREASTKEGHETDRVEIESSRDEPLVAHVETIVARSAGGIRNSAGSITDASVEELR